MSGASEANSGGGAQPPSVPDAVTRRRRRFSLVWMIPVVAALIAIYLIVTTIFDRGPLITITFKTGSGLTAQQTEVKHKDVALGMVENVHLAKDFRSVIVHVRMKREGERVLTDKARFWVVRPRLSTGIFRGSRRWCRARISRSIRASRGGPRRGSLPASRIRLG